MGNKQKNKSTQANTYGHVTPPVTADVTALRGMKAKADPSIPYYYANQRRDLEESYQNPLGSYTSPAVREAVGRGASKRLNLEQAQAQGASEYLADAENYNRQAQIAGMTAPRMVQTGGTATGTQSQGWISDAGGILGLAGMA